jgi:hypothetical protein
MQNRLRKFPDTRKTPPDRDIGQQSLSTLSQELIAIIHHISPYSMLPHLEFHLIYLELFKSWNRAFYYAMESNSKRTNSILQ